MRGLNAVDTGFGITHDTGMVAHECHNATQKHHAAGQCTKALIAESPPPRWLTMPVPSFPEVMALSVTIWALSNALATICMPIKLPIHVLTFDTTRKLKGA